MSALAAQLSPEVVEAINTISIEDVLSKFKRGLVSNFGQRFRGDAINSEFFAEFVHSAMAGQGISRILIQPVPNLIF